MPTQKAAEATSTSVEPLCFDRPDHFMVVVLDKSGQARTGKLLGFGKGRID
jgi:hypothetical protein